MKHVFGAASCRTKAKCVTGRVTGLSIGYDGDISFDVNDGFYSSTGVPAALPDGIRVSWTAVPGSGYDVWRSAKTQKRRRIGAIPGPPFDDLTAKRGMLYTYVVRAVNGAGKSAFSTAVTARRP